MWKLKVWMPTPRGWKLIIDRDCKTAEECRRRRAKIKLARLCLAYYGRVA